MRNKLCQEKFFEYTSKTSMFTNCLTSNKPLVQKLTIWQSKFKKSLFACFRKVRRTEGDPKLTTIDDLMNQKKNLMKAAKHKTIAVNDKLEEIEKHITEECASKEYEKLVKVINDLETEAGGTDSTNVWKQFRKAYPKKNKPIPTGVKNLKGKVITNPEEKKTVTLKHFKHRLRKRPNHEDTEEIAIVNEDTFIKRIEAAKLNQSPPFSMTELNKVLKNLKSGKAKDSEGYISELVKDGVIGNNLKESRLMMFNCMKYEMCIPDCLRTAHVTILHKKNCRTDLNNWRGIFVCSVLRSILMKLIYNRTYEKVNASMTDSQIGARKKKSVRNHLFILNSIISDVMGSVKKEPIDINVMDFKQMFDAEQLSVCLNALYEANVTDDMLALIYEANRTTIFAVKTPNGITRSAQIVNKVLQGDVLAPLI